MTDEARPRTEDIDAAELEAAWHAIERGDMVILSPDVASCVLPRAEAATSGSAEPEGPDSRLRAAVEAELAERPCGVLYQGRPKGWTCLDSMAEAQSGTGRYTDDFRARLSSGSELCFRCKVRAALSPEGRAGTMRLLGDCGFADPLPQSRCEACSRRIRCVYIVADEGWTFLLGRRCYAKLQAFLERLRAGDPAMTDEAKPQIALDEDDLTPTGRVILAAIEAARVDDLLYGGSSLDPSGWSNSTFPEAARRIALAIEAEAALPDSRLPLPSVEELAEMLHDLDGTQHYVTHESGYDGDDIEGVTCAMGIDGHMEDAETLRAALSPEGRTPQEYERRVEQMAAALHRDCELAADARYALDPRPDPWQGDFHQATRHYGQAHDLVRRIFPELDCTALSPEDRQEPERG